MVDLSGLDVCPTCGQELPGAERIRTLEAANILGGVSTKTVARWADEGKLGPVKMTESGHRRLRRGNVEAFAAEHADSRAS